MALAAALVRVEAMLAAIPRDGMANGTEYTNTSMPATSHIREHLRWPLQPDGTLRSVSDQVCRYGRFDFLDGPARDAIANKADMETAVIIAASRSAAWTYFGWVRASLNIAEVLDVPNGTAQLNVHADHEDELVAALATFSIPAARYMGLFFYNAISYETATTTISRLARRSLRPPRSCLPGLKSGSRETPSARALFSTTCSIRSPRP
ncbi:MAG: hypothetical protein ACRETL_01065 [Gammaproteobacteria bacterium]